MCQKDTDLYASLTYLVADSRVELSTLSSRTHDLGVTSLLDSLVLLLLYILKFLVVVGLEVLVDSIIPG